MKSKGPKVEEEDHSRETVLGHWSTPNQPNSRGEVRKRLSIGTLFPRDRICK